MREILFRGRRTDNNEWVYGSLVSMTNNLSYGDSKVFSNLHIIEEGEMDMRCFLSGSETLIDNGVIQIHKETIGQYTGLKDKNETKIFEGDILRLNKGICFVIWNQHGTGWAVESPGSCAVDTLTKKEFEESKIIGNIHDSRNLLK